MSLGDRIRDRLNAIGMTQAELSRRAAVPQSTLNSILQRDSRSSPHLIKLANALRTTPAYLLGETDDPESETAEIAMSFEERELLTLSRALTRDDFDAIAHLVRALAKAAVSRDAGAAREESGRVLHDRQLGYRAG